MKWDGLAEFYDQLRNMPEALTGEAAHITEGVANAAVLDIKSAYPVGPTGNLRDGVYVTHWTRGHQFSVGAIVTSSAPHAWLYENGSAARHYYTEATGAKHETGAMRRNTFVRTMMEHRRRAHRLLAKPPPTQRHRTPDRSPPDSAAIDQADRPPRPDAGRVDARRRVPTWPRRRAAT